MLAFLGGLGVLSGAGGEKAGSSRPEAESMKVMTEGALITGFGFGRKTVMESGQRVADFGLGRESVMWRMKKGGWWAPCWKFFYGCF